MRTDGAVILCVDSGRWGEAGQVLTSSPSGTAFVFDGLGILTSSVV